ncbi:signal peptidase I [Nonomuraea endophytica]|uniref:signal peptidase I n=1 Tax=Nonomuraea endophytica TaxID=714136 RepID=UPI0037CA345E
MRVLLVATVLLGGVLAGCGGGGPEVTIGSEAMAPTLAKGASAGVRPLEKGQVPKVGEVIAFKAPGWGPDGTADVYVRRVIGTPGSKVLCCDPSGRVMIDGEPLDEPYLKGQPASGAHFDVVVPEGRVWVLADNRPAAVDSRAKQDQPGGGGIALGDVIGVVELP